MKKFFNNVLSKFKKSKTTITLIRRKDYEESNFVALYKKTSDSYCIERERKLCKLLTALSQQ